MSFEPRTKFGRAVGEFGGKLNTIEGKENLANILMPILATVESIAGNKGYGETSAPSIQQAMNTGIDAARKRELDDYEKAERKKKAKWEDEEQKYKAYQRELTKTSLDEARQITSPEQVDSWMLKNSPESYWKGQQQKAIREGAEMHPFELESMVRDMNIPEEKIQSFYSYAISNPTAARKMYRSLLYGKNLDELGKYRDEGRAIQWENVDLRKGSQSVTELGDYETKIEDSAGEANRYMRASVSAAKQWNPQSDQVLTKALEKMVQEGAVLQGESDAYRNAGSFTERLISNGFIDAVSGQVLREFTPEVRKRVFNLTKDLYQGNMGALSGRRNRMIKSRTAAIPDRDWNSIFTPFETMDVSRYTVTDKGLVDNSEQNSQPNSSNNTKDSSGWIVGKTYKDASGNTARYLGNGQWQEVQ